MQDKSKISISQPKLSDLLYDISRRGTIRIPRFQREYVWARTDVAKLLDSVRREFPIGSFFFWLTPREFRGLSKQVPELQLPEPSDYDQIKMILDGQQRITSLLVAAKGLSLSVNGGRVSDYKSICYDLDKQEFLVLPRGEDRGTTLSVWRFFDQAGFEEIYDGLSPERRQLARDCRDTLCNYPLSIVEVEGKGLEEAVTIFERINQGGKKLSLFDLVVANTWSNDFDLKAQVRGLNAQLQQVGFGKIDEEVVTHALGLTIKGYCTRTHLLQLTNSDIKDNWKATTEALKLAVDFARENLGVRISEFLPYPSMLAIMAAFFAKLGDRSANAEQTAFLKSWFWKASFSQRYAKSLMTTLGHDWGTYFAPTSRGYVANVDFNITLNEKSILALKMYTRSAVKNAILCLLAMEKPRHFKNGSLITLDRAVCSAYNEAERHHIFPHAFLKRQHVAEADLLANFAYIPKELNQAIGDKNPSAYFAAFRDQNPEFIATLESHLIPALPASGLWDDNYAAFIRNRAGVLLKEVERLVGKVSTQEAELQDRPNAALDQLEIALRTYLDQVLSAASLDYWNLLPSDVRENVRRKTEERYKRHPFERQHPMPNRAKLDFLDIMDYCKIILSRWNDFEEAFGSKSEVDKHFLNLKEFRNVLKHGRELDNIVRKQGEASFEWLQRILRHVGLPVDGQLHDKDEEEPETNGQDIDISEPVLLEHAARFHTASLLAAFRQLRTFWREGRSKTYGGSFRYRIDRLNTYNRFAVGVNVTGSLKPLSDGQLLAWVRPGKLAEVLSANEQVIRQTVTKQFPAAFDRSSMTTVVPLSDKGAVSKFVSLMERFDAESPSIRGFSLTDDHSMRGPEWEKIKNLRDEHDCSQNHLYTERRDGCRLCADIKQAEESRKAAQQQLPNEQS